MYNRKIKKIWATWDFWLHSLDWQLAFSFLCLHVGSQEYSLCETFMVCLKKARGFPSVFFSYVNAPSYYIPLPNGPRQVIMQ